MSLIYTLSLFCNIFLCGNLYLGWYVGGSIAWTQNIFIHDLDGSGFTHRGAALHAHNIDQIFSPWSRYTWGVCYKYMRVQSKSSQKYKQVYMWHFEVEIGSLWDNEYKSWSNVTTVFLMTHIQLESVTYANRMNYILQVLVLLNSLWRILGLMVMTIVLEYLAESWTIVYLYHF